MNSLWIQLFICWNILSNLLKISDLNLIGMKKKKSWSTNSIMIKMFLKDKKKWRKTEREKSSFWWEYITWNIVFKKVKIEGWGVSVDNWQNVFSSQASFECIREIQKYGYFLLNITELGRGDVQRAANKVKKYIRRISKNAFCVNYYSFHCFTGVLVTKNIEWHTIHKHRTKHVITTERK